MQEFRNGADLLAIKPSEVYDNAWIVLADFGGAHPFVTWVATRAADGELDCHWGRYFETYAEAFESFKRRH